MGQDDSSSGSIVLSTIVLSSDLLGGIQRLRLELESIEKGEVDIIIASEHATFLDPHVTYGMVAGFESVHLLQKLPLGETLRVLPRLEEARIIADFDVTEKMLRYFIDKVHTGRFAARPRIVICVPSGITDPLESLPIYTAVFNKLGMAALVCTVIAIAVLPLMNRLSRTHGAHGVATP